MGTRSVCDYVTHFRTNETIEHGARPVEVSDQLPLDGAAAQFNAWFAVKVTNGVGTTWCAHAFAALALVSLPSTRRSKNPVVRVSSISEAFLELAPLSVVVSARTCSRRPPTAKPKPPATTPARISTRS